MTASVGIIERTQRDTATPWPSPRELELDIAGTRADVEALGVSASVRVRL